MQVKISYFYQIRFFLPYMIPMSTCVSDPGWYHDWGGPNHVFTDKRGILNGLRLLPVIVQGEHETCGCPCQAKDPAQCSFLQNYQLNLKQIDFQSMYQDMLSFTQRYCEQHNINHEPIAVLIVYETPKNKCSERDSLIQLFQNHNISCGELKYPISPDDY